LPVTFFLLAPKGMYGLNVGATGLAIKIVSLQFAIINVRLFFNARLLKLNFWSYVCHQLGCIGVLTVSAFIVAKAVDQIIEPSNMIVNFLISGIIYTGFVTILGLIFPVVFGLKKSDVQMLKGVVRGKILHI